MGVMLTENFSEDEVKCKCGECSGLPEGKERLDFFMHSLDMLQEIRDEYGRPIRLSSAYRCPAYNDRVSRTGRTGPHTLAAFDIKASAKEAHKIVKIALQKNVTGLGISQKGNHSSRFIHVDWLHSGKRPWIWSY